MKTAFLLTSLAVMVGGAALAEPAGKTSPEAEASKMDKAQPADAVTRPAKSDVKEDRFLRADTDGDGALSAAEMMAGPLARFEERLAQRIQDRIAETDANGDGMIQLDELKARHDASEARRPDGRAEKAFARLDRNADGVLDIEEFKQARKVGHPRRSE